MNFFSILKVYDEDKNKVHCLLCTDPGLFPHSDTLMDHLAKVSMEADGRPESFKSFPIVKW